MNSRDFHEIIGQRTNSLTITYIKNVIIRLILIDYISLLYVSKVCMHTFFFKFIFICTLLKILLSFTCMSDISSNIFLSIISLSYVEKKGLWQCHNNLVDVENIKIIYFKKETMNHQNI
jgi:hypothetical protein